MWCIQKNAFTTHNLTLIKLHLDVCNKVMSNVLLLKEKGPFWWGNTSRAILILYALVTKKKSDVWSAKKITKTK